MLIFCGEFTNAFLVEVFKQGFLIVKSGLFGGKKRFVWALDLVLFF